ncbi:hypothetical protein ACFLZV_02195 [Candidatus Margulisiibacteriota bacterium]
MKKILLRYKILPLTHDEKLDLFISKNFPEAIKSNIRDLDPTKGPSIKHKQIILKSLLLTLKCILSKCKNPASIFAGLLIEKLVLDNKLINLKNRKIKALGYSLIAIYGLFHPLGLTGSILFLNAGEFAADKMAKLIQYLYRKSNTGKTIDFSEEDSKLFKKEAASLIGSYGESWGEHLDKIVEEQFGFNPAKILISYTYSAANRVKDYFWSFFDKKSALKIPPVPKHLEELTESKDFSESSSPPSPQNSECPGIPTSPANPTEPQKPQLTNPHNELEIKYFVDESLVSKDPQSYQCEIIDPNKLRKVKTICETVTNKELHQELTSKTASLNEYFQNKGLTTRFKYPGDYKLVEPGTTFYRCNEAALKNSLITQKLTKKCRIFDINLTKATSTERLRSLLKIKPNQYPVLISQNKYKIRATAHLIPFNVGNGFTEVYVPTLNTKGNKFELQRIYDAYAIIHETIHRRFGVIPEFYSPKINRPESIMNPVDSSYPRLHKVLDWDIDPLLSILEKSNLCFGLNCTPYNGLTVPPSGVCWIKAPPNTTFEASAYFHRRQKYFSYPKLKTKPNGIEKFHLISPINISPDKKALTNEEIEKLIRLNHAPSKEDLKRILGDKFPYPILLNQIYSWKIKGCGITKEFDVYDVQEHFLKNRLDHYEIEMNCPTLQDAR